MGFRKDTYAKVWQVESVRDNFTKLRISISKKNKQTGQYEDDFSGFVNIYGSGVAAKAAKLKSGDRIKLGDVDVQSNYVKEKKTIYYNFNVYSFELVENEKKPDISSFDGNPEEGETDDLPW